MQNQSRRNSVFFALASLALPLTSLIAGTAHADCTTPVTHTVTSLNDFNNPGELRTLINSGVVQKCDIITIPPGTIILQDQLDVDKTITLRGAGMDLTIIDADGDNTGDRAFRVDNDDPSNDGDGVQLVLEGLTVQNGMPSDCGGGIRIENEGSVRLVNSAVRDNHVTAGAGGGVCIDDDGALTVENSEITNNQASSDAGGIYNSDGTVLVSGSLITENEAGSSGGAIYLSGGQVEIFNNSKINENIAGSSGGGLYGSSGTYTILDSEINLNHADSSGGGIYSDSTDLYCSNCTIKGNKATSDGGGISSHESAFVENSTISHNRADGDGGGIYNSSSYLFHVLNSTISDNRSDEDDDGSGDGGGISNDGYLTIMGSAVVGNEAKGDVGGGLYLADNSVVDGCLIADNTSLDNDGGGIAIDGDPVVIRNSTISGNRALGDQGNSGSDDSDGGGIWTDYPTMISNTTIVGNQADGHGGGLSNSGGYSVNLNNVTIAFNTADANKGGFSGGDGGGVHNDEGVVFTNTIIAGNSDLSPGPASQAPDCFSNFTTDDNNMQSGGLNIVQDPTGCEILGLTASVLNVDPLLDSSLSGNEGPKAGDPDSPLPIETLSLQAGSQAIDGGSNGSCEPTDQRGTPRPQGDSCDLGAVEVAADEDGDGILNDVDNCPDVSNGAQTDTDGDGDGDACDDDDDGDGVVDASDNCPLDDNADQADEDEDGAGDACEAAGTTGGTGGDGGGGCSLATAKGGGSAAFALLFAGLSALVLFRKKGEKMTGKAFLFVVSVLLGPISLISSPAQATTYVVESNADDGGGTTLRTLINGASDGDVITIPADTTILLDSGFASEIIIDKSITIEGAGPGSSVIDGNGAFTGERIFTIDDADTGNGVTISGVTIKNGLPGSDGGAIYIDNSGVLRLVNSELTNNEASGDGGAIYVNEDGSLVLESTTFSQNIASSSGGAIYGASGGYGSVIVKDSLFTKNESGSDGGAIYSEDGGLDVINTRFEDNQSSGSGGAIYNSYSAVLVQGSEFHLNHADSDAGAIYNSYTLMVDGSTFTENDSTSTGGAIYNSEILLLLNSTLDLNRAESDGGGLYNSSSATIDNTVISNNVGDTDAGGEDGGGLYNNDHMVIRNSTILGNKAEKGDGGGIYNSNDLIITNSTIANNIAENPDEGGGGISNQGSTAVIRGCTIVGNQALGKDVSEDAKGGGIYSSTYMDISNTTIANNRADGGGGGIFNDDNLTLNNVTITGNTADANVGGVSGGDGGGIFNDDYVHVANTIIAGNIDGSAVPTSPDCWSNFEFEDDEFLSLGPNIVQDATDCEIIGDVAGVLNVDPLFDPAGLKDNGGLTETIALQGSSPAVDAGNSATCHVTDQRGVERPQGTNCDLGAVELSGGGDGDGDGVLDASDNCTGVSNADQADANSDGEGNACDDDDDGDGVLDADDNCPLVSNPDQDADVCPEEDGGGGGDGGGGCSLDPMAQAANDGALGLLIFLALAGLASLRKRGTMKMCLRSLVLVGVMSLTFASSANAATLVVTDGGDDTPPAAGQFRQVMASANDGDVVVFDPAVTTVTLDCTFSQSGDDGEIDIDDSITIQGNGAGTTTIEADTTVGNCRLFTIDQTNDEGINVVFSGVTITGGQAPGTAGNGGAFLISNSGSLHLIDSVLTENDAEGTGFNGGGAVYVDSQGVLIVEGTTISKNRADTGGGIYNTDGGAVYIVGGSVITENEAIINFGAGGGGGDGGGIYADDGSLEIVGSEVSKNLATASGGGLYSSYTGATLVGSTFSGNVADSDNSGSGSGAGIYNNYTMLIDNCNILDNRGVTDCGAGGERAINGGGIYNGENLYVVNSKISGNHAETDGGGIYNSLSLLIENSTVSGNTADCDDNSDGDGGGLYNNDWLTMKNTLVTGNVTKAGDGGGLELYEYSVIEDSVISDNTAEDGVGGGIDTDYAQVIRNTTISGNKTLTGTNEGGGIYTDYPMLLTNVTIVDNEAAGDGGGIYNTDVLTLNNVTIASNTAGGDGGGIYNDVSTIIGNSIISGNSATGLGPDCYNDFTGSSTNVTAVGPSIIDDQTDCEIQGNFEAVSDASPALVALANNGGPSAGDPDAAEVVKTMALTTGPALDTGDAATCETKDARGNPRPQGVGCDLGAFELGVDSDGDAVDDNNDNCPDVSNADQTDGDSDGVGTVCDNCPTTDNTDQADGDGDGTGDACEAAAPPPAVCGNGDVEAGESCDDGDTNADDGCSDTCTEEDGFTCTGDPSVCTEDAGDGGGCSLTSESSAVGGSTGGFAMFLMPILAIFGLIRFRHRGMARQALTAAAIFFFAVGSAQAATFTVNSIVDDVDAVPGDGSCATAAAECTLRAAIQEANELDGSDTIQLAAEAYILAEPAVGLLTGPSTDEDLAVDGDLDIYDGTVAAAGDPADENLTIIGAGADLTSIDGNGEHLDDRVFHIDTDDNGIGVEMIGVTIRGGLLGDDGGGIYIANHGSLVLRDCVISGNQTDSSGDGGGIYLGDDGALVLDNTVVKDNISDDYGGGISVNSNEGSVLIFNGSSVSNNRSDNEGGGIYMDDGVLEIVNSQVVDNEANNYGGGIYSDDGAVSIVNSEVSRNAAVGYGGGIYNDDTMLIDNSVVADNRAEDGYSGGGIYNTELLTVTNNSLITRNSADEEGGGIYNDDALHLENSTVSENVADVDDDDDDGGGIYNSSYMILKNCLITGNSTKSGNGGGIYQDGYAIIDNCTISNNAAENNDGGGIYADSEPTVIRNSTISGNLAQGDHDTGASEDSAGGGIWTSQATDIVNSTIVGNSADGDGGGIFMDYHATLTNVTVAFNTANANNGGFSAGNGGGFYVDDEAVITNSIIAGNTALEGPDCFNSFFIEGDTLVSSGPNIVQNQDECEIQGDAASVLSVDPLFDAAGLANNGGTTLTLSLQGASPAIDAGHDATCHPTDQRGTPRPQGAACDLGALEVTPDIDGDGIDNTTDNCPDVSNVGQTDTDSDGAGDACDTDDDGDGVADADDSCPLVANTGTDADGDGIDAACDGDDASVCGNGEVESGEDCDDGDTDNGDGCSSTCVTEEDSGGGCSLIR